MPPPVFTISTARQKFFSLFETVTAHRGRKVVISSRGTANHAVLVAESYLNALESAAKRLRDIDSGKAQSVPEFKLVGTLQIVAGTADPLAEMRTESAAAWERKLSSFGQ